MRIAAACIKKGEKEEEKGGRREEEGGKKEGEKERRKEREKEGRKERRWFSKIPGGRACCVHKSVVLL